MKSISDLPEQTKKIFENFLQRDVKQVKESVPEKSYTGYTWMNCSANNSFISLKVYYQNCAKDDYYKIEKVIELSRGDFEYYSQNLNQETDFIANNKQIMGFDEEGCFHCFFIKQEESKKGILICQNKDGKIYSGYLPDYTVIEH